MCVMFLIFVYLTSDLWKVATSSPEQRCQTEEVWREISMWMKGAETSATTLYSTTGMLDRYRPFGMEPIPRDGSLIPILSVFNLSSPRPSGFTRRPTQRRCPIPKSAYVEGPDESVKGSMLPGGRGQKDPKFQPFSIGRTEVALLLSFFRKQPFETWFWCLFRTGHRVNLKKIIHFLVDDQIDGAKMTHDLQIILPINPLVKKKNIRKLWFVPDKWFLRCTGDVGRQHDGTAFNRQKSCVQSVQHSMVNWGQHLDQSSLMIATPLSFF